MCATSSGSRILAEKLGAVGDDDAIDTLLPLLADTRRGVPEAMLEAFGTIGTQHAVDILIAHTSDDRPTVPCYAAILPRSARRTHLSAKAEAKLLALAQQQQRDPAQEGAIAALGSIGSASRSRDRRARRSCTRMASTPGVRRPAR